MKLPKSILHKLLKRGRSGHQLVSNLLEYHPRHWISDDQGAVLMGEVSKRNRNVPKMGIMDSNGNLVGFAFGKNAALFQQLINNSLRDFQEKRKLNTEILDLYRELNAVYQFSDILSGSIELRDISEALIQEVLKIFNPQGVWLLLKNSDKGAASIATVEGASQKIKWKNIPSADKTYAVLHQIERPELLDNWREDSRFEHLLREQSAIMFSPLHIEGKVTGAILLENKNGQLYRPLDLKLLISLSMQTSSALESATLYEQQNINRQKKQRELNKVFEATQRFVPFEFLNALGKDKITEVKLGDHTNMEVSVLFADIRGYTGLAEKLSDRENFQFVSEFNRRVGPLIRQNGGFINQYLGDAIMALHSRSPEDALQAAIDIQSEVRAFNEVCHEYNLPPIALGIGLHTGNLIMGITGDEKRLDAAIISDTVNTASRIEGLSKHYGAGILLTEDCIEKIPEEIIQEREYNFRFLGVVQLKGKSETVRVYECTNGDDPDLHLAKYWTREQFNWAMQLYMGKDFKPAHSTFKLILEQSPNDKIVQFFIQKIQTLLGQQSYQDWNGIQIMETK